jgi:hypothetical protein
MNSVFFACPACEAMTDAGYRWAYVALERSGVVRRNSRVSVQAVLSAEEYWNSSESPHSVRLRDEILPAVRRFLEAHAEHGVVYGDYAEVTHDQPKAFLNWLEVGPDATPTPRWFTEVLDLKTWTQVTTWIKGHRAPWWWSDEELKDVARVRFGELVKQRGGITTR